MIAWTLPILHFALNGIPKETEKAPLVWLHVAQIIKLGGFADKGIAINQLLLIVLQVRDVLFARVIKLFLG